MSSKGLNMSSREILYVSKMIPKLMVKVLKHANCIQEGFLFFRYKTIMIAEFDQKESEALLEKLIIKKDNVIRYLQRKYIPTWKGNNMIFKDQACIQSVQVKPDHSLIITIAKSEPHKIITDTIHVMNLLDAKGVKHNSIVKYHIGQLQIAYQDVLLYNAILRDFKMPVPYSAIIYEKQLKAKYKKLESIAKIKKRSVKRKFLRHLAYIGKIEWVEVRKVINIKDFSEINIKTVCNEIRADAKERGVVIDF